jgi:hypothetical protein
MSREALQKALNLQDRKSFRERYLKPSLAEGLIEMTIPDKPNSSLQKYRLTDKGWKVCGALETGSRVYKEKAIVGIAVVKWRITSPLVT